MGAAWEIGALAAISEALGWDPGSADRIIGTSAGAVIGSLIACGVPPWYLAAHESGERIPGVRDAHGRSAADADHTNGYCISRGWSGVPMLGPGSWGLARRAVHERRTLAPVAALAAWVPRGIISTASIERVIASACRDRWAPHDGLRVVACDYSTGQGHAIGAPDAPEIDLPAAVAASCAIPGFFTPVVAEGRRWVDGGLRSFVNADLLATDRLDLLVVLSPLAGPAPISRPGGRARRIWSVPRFAAAQLQREIDALSQSGTRVVIFEPTSRDREVMGRNVLNSSRRRVVAETARLTVAETLKDERLVAALAGLPRTSGPLVRRPATSPSAWPGFYDLARRRRDRLRGA